MSAGEPRECAVCGWLYDPASGDDDAQVPPGVHFDDLPESYACPRCHAPKARFLRLAEDPAARIVAAYRAIDERMRGLPIHNPRLRVEAIGFRAHGALVVGALVTPWFLNLVVFGHPLPVEGESVELPFPGGRFAAMGASPEGIAHLVIPLVSPMNHVADQGAARAMAEESLRLVLTPNEARDADGGVAEPPAAPIAFGRRALLGGLLGG